MAFNGQRSQTENSFHCPVLPFGPSLVSSEIRSHIIWEGLKVTESVSNRQLINESINKVIIFKVIFLKVSLIMLLCVIRYINYKCKLVITTIYYMVHIPFICIITVAIVTFITFSAYICRRSSLLSTTNKWMIFLTSQSKYDDRIK